MKSADIRKTFLEFFKGKDHKIVPSAPLVVKDDPSLLFINAGMNPFKDVFLGTRKAEAKRVADTQKCLRVSGKHNDLEEVGVDTYHHTMFEMLGNWSFGDYFKPEAIAWAWELITEVYGIDPENLYPTIFAGNQAENLPEDTEAFNEWLKFVPEERILKFGKEDNFWEMGGSGPCGPCSELHIDLRRDEEKQKISGADLVNTGHPEVIEIWNLVFISLNRLVDGSLEPLKEKHVDTGMGFERLAMVIQGKTSTYDSDIFTPLKDQVAKHSGFQFGESETTDISMRVVVDHIRAIAFSIADGQVPSNTGAGYVIRRILRRAVRYGYTHLKLEEPFLYEMVPTLVKQMGETFPELKKQQSFIEQVIREEETAFLRTLGSGIKRFEEIKTQIKVSKSKVIDGQAAFELYDTYGFPLDLTSLMAKENSLEVDVQGFQNSLETQQKRSRKDQDQQAGDWQVLREDDVQEFVGYDYLEAEVQITRYRELKVKKDQWFQVVFQITPFFGESGGQVGDTGWIELDGSEKIEILKTSQENGLIIHWTKALPKNLNAKFQAKVNKVRRSDISSNHSATHLLHAALKEVLGSHVEQKGSLVAPDYLRFDFAHFAGLKDEELASIEQLVNQKIMDNIPLEEDRNVPLKAALDGGATALFGEKYGDVVRVITFDKNFSKELCGGTHVDSTAAIGLFSIRSEASSSAGVRRIEALSGRGALAASTAARKELSEIYRLLKSPKDGIKALESLIKQNSSLLKDVEGFQAQEVQQVKQLLKQKIETFEGVAAIFSKVGVSNPEQLKTLAFQLHQEGSASIIALAAEIKGKAHLALYLSKTWAEENQKKAGSIIQLASKNIKGGGGGQDFFASAGGADPKGIEKALAEIRTALV